MSTVWTGYGRPAYGELRAAVAERKRPDPLAPVTVLVGTNLAGVHVRRALAHGFGAHHGIAGLPGIAGLSVLTLDRLAERIATPALAGSGRRPITEPVLAAAWRRALASEPSVFASVADHPATVRALAAAHRELREVDDTGLDAIACGGTVAADVTRLHRRVVALLTDDWYDVTDLRRTANARHEGNVIHFLPQDVPASGARFLDTTGDLLTIAGVDRQTDATAVLSASDADDEVRCMVRRIAAALRTTPAGRIAVLYSQAHPYARLLAEHLAAAGIRWNGRGVRPTIERRLARPLPNLCAAAQNGWRRVDVLAAFLNPPANWERISRAAGVVGGDDWEIRLKAYGEPADALRNQVADLRARMAEGSTLTSWPALAEWGRQTYTALVGDLEEGLPEDEQRAAAAVLRTLDALCGLESVEPAADLALLDLTLDLELSGDLPRHGRIGDGVLVAPLSSAIGLDVDAVFVLGLSEDLVSGRIRPDALLPDEVRVLTGGQLPTARDQIERRRRHVLAAFAAAPIVTASYPRGDLRRNAQRRPSRFLRGPELTAPSFAAGISAGTDLASEQEWRTRAAAAGVAPPDRVIELATRMRNARNSDLLTRFDGDLSGAELPDPADGPPISPTALEFWSRCPHAYFVQRLLGVAPIETPEERVTISPIELGNLYHKTLDRFFVEQDARGAVPGGTTAWSPAQRADLRRVAVEVADDLSVRGQTGHRLLWRQELAGVLARLEEFLAFDDRLRAATGRRQVHSELEFGMTGRPPVPVPLADGRILLMKGSADRIDRAGAAIVVVDYKSGGSRSFAGLGVHDPTLGGTKLQLPAYGLAARMALGAPGAAVVAEYWFVHREAGRRVELPITRDVEDAFTAAVTVIADGIAGGLFPHRPPDDDGYAGHVPCHYCDPDGLGAGEHRELWKRKRDDPRDRLRAAFADRPEPAAADALEDLDTAAIGTLHAFAQRLLTEHPIEAGLPPLIEVGDEVASGVTADARWSTLRAELLDDPDLTDTLMLAMAAGVKIEHLRSLAYHLNANWDLIASRVLASPVPALPPMDVAAMISDAHRLAALAAQCASDEDKLLPILARLGDWATTLDAAPSDAERLTVLGEAIAVGWNRGQAQNWQCYGIARLRADGKSVAEAAAGLRQQILDGTLRRLAQRLGHAVLHDASVRRSEGRLEFHDLLVLARNLLRSRAHGAAVRARLQRRYRRLLLDEFQDTDPIQIELAVRIAGGATAIQDDWADVAVPGGSLFLVGDPKQSIYRFRRADIAMYLHAQQKIGREVVLNTNFRTTAPILDWINTVFGRLIVASPDSQPEYRPLAPVRAPAPDGPPVLMLGAVAHADKPNAGQLREREAADVVAAVRTALAERWQVADGTGWRDVELRDICVLVPARTSLPQLESALDAAGIGYHPGATSLVYRSREVRDLLTAARAVDDPTDELSLVTALRSPLFGCGDDDLWAWRRAGARFNVFSSADLGSSHPVASGIEYLRRLHHDREWLAPSEVLNRLVTERRMFEQAVGGRRTRDVWRRLRLVVDQARAWSDTAHGGLREYLAWATRQGSDTARVAEAALPETDTDTLKIMTIHSAKGLEFPMVIVSGLTTRLVRPSAGLQVLWPRSGGYALKLHGQAKTADFDAAQPIDEQMSADEKLRLLYVACTRARDHLVVSVHRTSNGASTSAELIAGAGPGVPSLAPDSFDLEMPTAAPVTAPPSFDHWTTAMGASRASAARDAAVSASGFEGSLPSVSDPGLAKGPRDLELAPWHKGRYGTAIGRAVHGALQTVDLASGAGLDDAVASQVMAEGVVPYAALVTDLVTSALSAPVLRRAAVRPHWRESYAATVIGDTVLEGVIDLLYRDDDGLVIVDYKTDAVPLSALSARVDFYRPQMAAYAAAVEAAVGEPAARCVLLFLSPAGAEAWEVPQIPAAVTAIRASVIRASVIRASVIRASVTGIASAAGAGSPAAAGASRPGGSS